VTGSRYRDREDRKHEDRMRMMSFETFFRQYWPRLVRYLVAQASETALAEDVAADTMMLVLDNWDDLVIHPRPDSWTFKVATQKLRQLDAWPHDHCRPDEDLASFERDLHIAAATDVAIDDHLDLIAEMRSLPARQCEVLCLHYFGGYTLAETARLLDIKPCTAKEHLNRGLENLRRRRGLPAVMRAPWKIPA
jgi:RNA polymerase sigma factor (sigma-70 family)